MLPSKEVCKRLGLSRQNFHQSGLADKIRREFPFGPRFPLYDELDISLWALALKRRQGLIALGRMSEKSPLVEADAITDTWDTECPECGGFAIADSETDVDEYIKLVRSGEFPRRVWCHKDGIVS